LIESGNGIMCRQRVLAQTQLFLPKQPTQPTPVVV